MARPLTKGQEILCTIYLVVSGKYRILPFSVGDKEEIPIGYQPNAHKIEGRDNAENRQSSVGGTIGVIGGCAFLP